jgi:hypothetical protein
MAVVNLNIDVDVDVVIVNVPTGGGCPGIVVVVRHLPIGGLLLRHVVGRCHPQLL